MISAFLLNSKRNDSFSDLLIGFSFLSFLLVGIKFICQRMEDFWIQGIKNPFPESGKVADASGYAQIGIKYAVDVLTTDIEEFMIAIRPKKRIEDLFSPGMQDRDKLPVPRYIRILESCKGK